MMRASSIIYFVYALCVLFSTQVHGEDNSQCRKLCNLDCSDAYDCEIDYDAKTCTCTLKSGIIAAIVIGCLLVLLFCICVYCWRRRSLNQTRVVTQLPQQQPQLIIVQPHHPQANPYPYQSSQPSQPPQSQPFPHQTTHPPQPVYYYPQSQNNDVPPPAYAVATQQPKPVQPTAVYVAASKEV